MEPHWLGRIVLASSVANPMAQGGILSSTQVYDRVVPAYSLATLNVLVGGVLLSEPREKP